MERGVWGTQIINVDSYGFQMFGGKRKVKLVAPAHGQIMTWIQITVTRRVASYVV